MRKTGTIIAWVLGTMVLTVLAAFALLQTGPGKRILADGLNRMLAGPDSAIRIGTIAGVVPFDISVSRITRSDKDGPWLIVDDAALRWSPSALLGLRLRIDRLTAASVDMLRAPSQGPSRSGGPAAAFALPRLPVSVELRDFRIGRLALSPALVGGDQAPASIAAHGLLAAGRAALSVDLARADGQPGRGAIDARFDETANTLALRIDIDEPTGIAMDALTGRADHLPLRVTLDGGGALSGWTGKIRLDSGDGVAAEATLDVASAKGAHIAIAGTAAFAALLPPNARALIGERLSFAIAGAFDGKGGVSLAPSHVALAAMSLDAEGALGDGGALSGTLRIAMPDASAIGMLTGLPVGGAIAVDGVLSGTADRPRLALSEHGRMVFEDIDAEGLTIAADISGLDSLAGKDPSFAFTVDARADGLRGTGEGGVSYGPFALHAAGTADAAGRLIEAREAMLRGAGVSIDGAGRLDHGAGNGRATVSVPDLAAPGRLLGLRLGGTLSADITAATAPGGALDIPEIDVEAHLDKLAFQTARIDHLDAKIVAPQGLGQPTTIDARLRSGPLDETVTASVTRLPGQSYRLGDLRLSGTGGAVSGAALVDLTRRELAAKLDGAIGDLSVWSAVVGEAASGKVAFAVNLPGGGAQGPVTVTLDHVALGSGPGAIGVEHAALAGSASGDYGHPAGTLGITLAGARAGGASIARASAHVSAKDGAAAFRLSGAGRLGDPIAVDLAGTASQDRGSNSARLSRLTASLGPDHLSLTGPAVLTIAPGSYGLAGLALDVDGGTITGSAALSPRALSADLKLRRLPLHPIAALAGAGKIGGTVDGRITLGGAPGAPQAHLSLTTAGLDLETDGPPPRPALSLAATADWLGQRVNFGAQLSTATGEKLAMTGSAPFAVDLATFTPLDARDKTLSITLDGGGRLENLTSLAPLGEDRITGAFTVHVAVGGAVAAPTTSGRIAVTGGRYASMALGTELNAIDLAVNGSGQRFTLDHLTATDGKAGALKAAGSIDLAVRPAAVALDIGFTDFLVAQTDNATATADGDLKIDGTLDAMTASGAITARRAELYIPDRLPASVVNLDVVEIGGNRKIADAPKAKPVAPVALRIALDAPGQVFVRGHGVTSEWRSHIDISGDTAAPLLTGELAVVNGTIDLLGQSFSIDRGVVRFDGGATIDPVLDIQASAAASSVTATIAVTGTAGAPKIALSSIPVLPQDEILSQVLFGSNVSSLTASQGLQLAAAAASLAQGGPGVLDRVRKKIGLDRLDFGGGNPNGTQGGSTGATVTGGKYVANGVLVGVSQGITANSSQALVQVEVTPHISVNSTFGAASGSGFGAKYSLDY
jgi:translocation and assembly module TamB